MPHQSWYPLDNSAKIFPAIKNGKVSAVFRLSVELTIPVKRDILQQALEDILPRFPSFALRMRPGLFWYYLEPNKAQPTVFEDTAYPCRRLYRKDNNGYLFRVLYYNNKLSVEFFHSLADGTGALMFTKTLAARYLERCLKITIPAEKGVADWLEQPSEAETEDSYKVYARGTRRRNPLMPVAWHVKGQLEPSGRIHVIRAEMPVDQLKQKAREYGVTINDYLVASYIYTFCQIQSAEERRHDKPVVIAVPVNMRRYYPSQTLRNFFTRVYPSVHQDYGEYSFEEIISEVHHYMKLRTREKYLNVQMAGNIKSESMLVTRLIPLPVKNLILRTAYLFRGDSRITSTMTNVGPVELPAEMAEYVRSFDVLMGPSLGNWINASILSYNGNLTVTFTRRIREAHVERLFLRHLVKQGIHIKVSSNDIQTVKT